jgi:putative ABC transport system substrate-binding protein
VFVIGDDPVALGLVASFNRPGGNITGITGVSGEVVTKQFGLLHDMLPGTMRIGALVNPSSLRAKSMTADLEAAASATGLQIEILAAANSRDIDATFASLVQKQTRALLVTADTLFISRRLQLAMLAVKHSIPMIAAFRESAEAGALMSYGPNAIDVNRQVGIYTGRILKGEKPADLPVIQASKLEFILNLQTAKTIAIEVPNSIQLLADEVIE